ncbi:MAG: hypothetical protein ACK413_03145 [Patescibacteria group bacterium]
MINLAKIIQKKPKIIIPNNRTKRIFKKSLIFIFSTFSFVFFAVDKIRKISEKTDKKRKNKIISKKRARKYGLIIWIGCLKEETSLEIGEIESKDEKIKIKRNSLAGKKKRVEKKPNIQNIGFCQTILKDCFKISLNNILIK